MTDRREFLKKSAAWAAALAIPGAWSAGGATTLAALPPADASIGGDPSIKELMMEALNAAKLTGASYADVRIGRQRQNFVFTREHQIQNVVDTDSLGCGVRALVDGTWGFAATRVLTKPW
jgi:TldD protein